MSYLAKPVCILYFEKNMLVKKAEYGEKFKLYGFPEAFFMWYFLHFCRPSKYSAVCVHTRAAEHCCCRSYQPLRPFVGAHGQLTIG